MLELTESIPIRKREFDVIVAGGGLAGVAAALAARRAGKSVILLEKSTILGGLATLGLINFFVPMCNGRGKQIIFGMAEEFLRLSIKYGYDTIPQDWQNGEPGFNKSTQRYTTRFSESIFALTLTELMIDNGVELLFDTVATRPVMNGKHCDGVVIEGKSGREFVRGKIIVDVTGDADILYRAGVPTVQGKNYYFYAGKVISVESCQRAVEANHIHDAFYGVAGGRANLYGKGHPEGMKFYKGTDTDDVNEFLIKNQIEMLQKLKDDDRNKRDVIKLPGMAQFRTTRCIDGDYTMQEEDTYRHFDDSIAAICDFERRDYLFEIPYRALIKTGYDNLITAGRSAAGKGYAWDVIRVIPPAIITGQAAGIAAALAIETNSGIDQVNVKELQERLQSAQVDIHFDDALVPADNNKGGEKVDIGHE